MEIITKVLGMIGTNCYMVKNEETKEALIIDPAFDAKTIESTLDANDCKPVAILLTHGHFDHMLAAEDLRDYYHIPVIAGKCEEGLLADTNANLSASFYVDARLVADQLVDDLENLHLAGLDIQVLHTPGHTGGSVCYYFHKEQKLFSGDTLFCESVGRTDYPTGSASQIVRSVKEKLMILPDETNVYPGHGESTTIQNEKQYNPFCQ